MALKILRKKTHLLQKMTYKFEWMNVIASQYIYS